jgi:hypothetical protein
MAIVLLIVGLLATAAGLVMIGFGIPINAFSLGNTLIVAGTVALSAGLVLIGLASVIGQLRRIAEALSARPLLRSGRPAESVETMVPPTARMTPAPPPAPVPTRMPMPPRPPEMREPAMPELAQPESRMPESRMPESRMPESRMPEPRQPRPRIPAAAPNEPPGPLDWLRSKPKLATMAMQNGAMPAEPAMVEVTDEAPLSPRTLQRQPKPPAELPAFEPKTWPQGRGGDSSELRPTARPEQSMPRATPHVEMPRATPQAEAPSDKDEFDLVWPDRAAPGQPAESGRREAAPDMPAPPFRPRESRPADRRPESAPKPAAERGPAILKSGVIDGMPYTLYADGSIEAELPQGMVKFASVDALRAHLERHG